MLNRRRPLPWLRVSGFAVLLWSCSRGDDDIGECFVARRVDQCCSIPVAASQRDLDSQPCLQHWDRTPVVAACPAAEQCNLRTCPDSFVSGSWTRVAERSGSSCSFRHECDTDADCTLATNEYQCCSCPSWVPRRVLERDSCYVSAGQIVSPSCEACTYEPDCNPCPSASPGRCADDGTGWRKCLASP
jgi:hypothetical protein